MTYQIMYSSQAAERMRASDLEQILIDAREGNAQRDVRGVLVYADGVFMQILEGDEDVVRALMESITADARHGAVKVFHQGVAERPAFASWHMAYLAPSPEELASWAGLEGTVDIERLLEHVREESDRVPGILLSIVRALADTAQGPDS